MHYKVSIVLVDETITKSAERRGRGGGGRQQRWLCASAGHRPPVKQARIETTRRLAGDNAGPALVLPGGAPLARVPPPAGPGEGAAGPCLVPVPIGPLGRGGKSRAWPRGRGGLPVSAPRDAHPGAGMGLRLPRGAP